MGSWARFDEGIFGGHGDAVVVATETTLASFDDEGRLLWSQPAGEWSADRFAGSEPVLAGSVDGLIAIAGDDHMALLERGGERRWELRLPREVHSLSFGPDGRLAVIGVYASGLGTLELAGISFPDWYGFDIYVLVLDQAGHGIWGRGIGSDSFDYGWGVAFDGDRLWVVGSFGEGGPLDGRSELDVGGPSPIVSLYGDREGFLALYDELGAHVWSHIIGLDEADEAARAVATSPCGIAVTGYAHGLEVAFPDGRTIDRTGSMFVWARGPHID